MEKIFVGQVTQKAILKYKDSFVLVKEKGGEKWILPGGRLNVDENTDEGLLREIKEELSVDAVIENIISTDVYHNKKEGDASKLFVFYSATVLPNQEIVINNEISDIAYFSKKEDLEKYPMHEMQKSVLEKFLG
jgi:8-oxo-dGTP pyrophosphatase MutT (NUDIX family)